MSQGVPESKRLGRGRAFLGDGPAPERCEELAGAGCRQYRVEPGAEDLYIPLPRLLYISL